MKGRFTHRRNLIAASLLSVCAGMASQSYADTDADSADESSVVITAFGVLRRQR